MKLFLVASQIACALVITVGEVSGEWQANAQHAALASNTLVQEPTGDHGSGSLSGNWQVSWTGRDGKPKEGTVQIQQDGYKLSGTFRGERGSAPLTGSLRGNQLSLSVDERGREVSFTGTFDGNKMSGMTKRGRSWTATRN